MNRHHFDFMWREARYWINKQRMLYRPSEATRRTLRQIVRDVFR